MGGVLGGGGGATNVVSSTTLVPGYAQTHVTQYVNAMVALSEEPFHSFESVFPSAKIYADQDINETDGIKNLAARARNGHAIISKGETYLRDTLDGLKLTNNPKLDQAYLRRAEVIIQEFEEESLPRLARQMNYSGNYGSKAHHVLMAKAAEAAMEKLASIGMDVYFVDYNSERDHQSTSLSAALIYGNEDARNAEILRHAGQYQREWKQGKLDADYNEWRATQASYIQKLEMFANALKAVTGAGHTKIEPLYRPSDISQIAGIALTGLGIYGMMKSSNPGIKDVGGGQTEAARMGSENAQYSPLPMTIPRSGDYSQGENYGG